MDQTGKLKVWLKTYLKSRDAMTQAITGFEEQNSLLIIKKTTGDQRFLILPEPLDLKSISDNAQSQLSVVILNTKRNLEFILTNWSELAKFKQLCFYFVNPQENDKWLLYPYTHNQITEKAALRRGIEAMFAEVPSCI